MTTRLDAIVARQFPHHEPSDAFEAVLTILKLRLATRVLKRQPLSIIGGFMLRTIDLGYDTVERISGLLGVTIADLAGPGAELLQAKLIDYGPIQLDNTRPLGITERGRKHLDENQSLLVPKRKTFNLHFEPLAKELTPTDRATWSIENVSLRNTFALPFDGRYPTLEDLHLSEVAEAVRQDARQPEDLQIIELLDLHDPYVEYLPVDVVVLVQPQTGDVRLAIFDGLRYLERASYEITRAQERGELVIPADVSERLCGTAEVPVDIPGAMGEPLTQLILAARHVEDVRREVQRREDLVWTTTDREEREQLFAEIDNLKIALERAEADRIQTQTLLNETAAVAVRSIHTRDHRPLLFEALRLAESEVLVISPWMNLRTVDSELCKAIRNATDRGVRVRIGFGFRSHRPSEQQRNEANVRAVLDILRREMHGGRTDLVEVIDLVSIHHKVLVCDRKFCVIGSFNWLSYRGDPDEGFRQEVGCVVEGAKEVENLVTPRIQELDAGYQVYSA
jgi:hypothetical protein